HDLGSLALARASGNLSHDLSGRVSGLPPHSRGGLPGPPNSLLSQPTRQASTLTPRLPGGCPCVAHCLPGFLLYAHHVQFSCTRILDPMCRIRFRPALCNSTASPRIPLSSVQRAAQLDIEVRCFAFALPQ